MSKNKIFLIISTGLLVGIGAGSIYAVQLVTVYVLLALAIAVLVVVYSPAKNTTDVVERGRQAIRVRMVLVGVAWLMCGAGLGLWRIHAALAVQNQFLGWIDTKQDFEGIIVAEPDVRQDKQLLTIEPEGFSQRILITTTKASALKYGDLVWVRGKITVAEAFDDFDYPGYLARHSTYALARYPKVITVKQNQGVSILYHLFELKNYLISRLGPSYDSLTENLLLGILIGAKKGLDTKVIENFNTTGTSHVLAASGFNITIFLTGLSYAAYVIGRKNQLLLSFICVIVFVIFAGPSASVLRATGMGMVVMLAILTGRLYSSLPTLLGIAGLMASLNPRLLYWDAGFQLSVAATGGILVGLPLVTQLRPRFGAAYKSVELLGVTMCAIIATLPLSLWHFGRLSIVAPLANFIIVPLVPFIMAFGALSFVPYIGLGIGWINNYILRCVLWVVENLARFSWASIDYKISGRWVLISYGTLAAIVLMYFFLQRKKVRPIVPNSLFR